MRYMKVLCPNDRYKDNPGFKCRNDLGGIDLDSVLDRDYERDGPFKTMRYCRQCLRHVEVLIRDRKSPINYRILSDHEDPGYVDIEKHFPIATVSGVRPRG